MSRDGGHDVGHVVIDRYESREEASEAAADVFVRLANEAVEERGRFTVALAGGDAPELLYRLLGEEPRRSRIPWDSVHLFWGDDRCVPPAHPRSNFGMAAEAFVNGIPIPEDQVHRMRGEDDPEEAARAYESEVRDVLGDEPRFDLMHLGVGDDAHTASLFPYDHAALLEQERLVISTLFRDLGEHRLTLTLPVINRSRYIEVLVTDREPAPAVKAALEGPLDPFRLPIQLVRPASDARMVWMLTPASAARLSSDDSTHA
jgi:6-phosphogluconolactonase